MLRNSFYFAVFDDLHMTVFFTHTVSPLPTLLLQFVERLLDYMVLQLNINTAIDFFITANADVFATCTPGGEYSLIQYDIFKKYEGLIDHELGEFAAAEGYESTEGLYQALTKSVSETLLDGGVSGVGDVDDDEASSPESSLRRRRSVNQKQSKDAKLLQVLAAFEFEAFARMMNKRARVLEAMPGL